MQNFIEFYRKYFSCCKKVAFWVWQGCSNHLNLEMEAECLTKNLSYLNLNISSPEQKMVETAVIKVLE